MDIPVPVPNTEVKHPYVDDTPFRGKVDSRRLFLFLNPFRFPLPARAPAHAFQMMQAELSPSLCPAPCRTAFLCRRRTHFCSGMRYECPHAFRLALLPRSLKPLPGSFIRVHLCISAIIHTWLSLTRGCRFPHGVRLFHRAAVPARLMNAGGMFFLPDSLVKLFCKLWNIFPVRLGAGIQHAGLSPGSCRGVPAPFPLPDARMK